MQLPGHEGTKCWFARGSTKQEATKQEAPRNTLSHAPVMGFARGSTNQEAPRIRPVLDSPQATEADSRIGGQIKRASGQLKASAADPPDETPARAESQDTLPLHKREPSSILIWGTPMRIDSTWEEIFERRERSSE
jgi:hypothetical protein